MVRNLMVNSLAVLREPNVELRDFTVRAAKSATTQRPSGTLNIGLVNYGAVDWDTLHLMVAYIVSGTEIAAYF